MATAIAEKRAVPVVITIGADVQQKVAIPGEASMAALLLESLEKSVQNKYYKQNYGPTRRDGEPITSVPILKEKLDLLGFSRDATAQHIPGSLYSNLNVYKVYDPRNPQYGVMYVKAGDDVPKEWSGAQIFLRTGLGRRAVASAIYPDEGLWVMKNGGDMILRHSLPRSSIPPGSAGQAAEEVIHGIFDFVGEQTVLDNPLHLKPGGIQPSEYLDHRIKAEKKVVSALTQLGIPREIAKQTKIKLKVNDGDGKFHYEELGSFDSSLAEMDFYMLDESGNIKKDFTFMGTVLGDLSTKNQSVMKPDSEAMSDYEDIVVQSLTIHDIGGYTDPWGNLAEPPAIPIKTIDTLTTLHPDTPLSLTMLYNREENTLTIDNLRAVFSVEDIEYNRRGEKVIQERAHELGPSYLEEVTTCGAIIRFGELAQNRTYRPEEVVYLLAMTGKHLNKARDLKREREANENETSLRRVMRVAQSALEVLGISIP